MIGCDCAVCVSDDPKDRRDRSAAMVRHDQDSGLKTFLIDTGPDLRYQMIRHGVNSIDGVVYTHQHADHVFGLDDLRRFNALMQRPIDIYAESGVMDYLKRTFGYIFDPSKNINKSFIADLIPNLIRPGEMFELSGLAWTPLRLMHGRLPVLGFRVGDVAYCTDCSSIPPETYPLLDNLDVLVIDALRYRHHPTHMTVDQALQVIDQITPRRAFLTHIAHDIQHADLVSRLPEGVEPGYDGLEIVSDA